MTSARKDDLVESEGAVCEDDGMAEPGREAGRDLPAQPRPADPGEGSEGEPATD